MLNATPPALRRRPPLAAIRIGASDRDAGGTRYGRLLTGFMRALAALWFAQGVAQWAAVLTAGGDGPGALDGASPLGTGAIVFFCAMDMIAAVGLWLAAFWGGAVWLVVVAAQDVAVFVLPRFFPYDRLAGVAGSLLAAVYVLLAVLAAREAEPR